MLDLLIIIVLLTFEKYCRSYFCLPMETKMKLHKIDGCGSEGAGGAIVTPPSNHSRHGSSGRPSWLLFTIAGTVTNHCHTFLDFDFQTLNGKLNANIYVYWSVLEFVSKFFFLYGDTSLNYNEKYLFFYWHLLTL